MVDWEFEMDLLNNKGGWHKTIKADSYGEALSSLKMNDLKKMLEQIDSIQTKIDVSKKNKPKFMFNMDIGINADFFENCVKTGVVLKEIEANTIEELIKELSKLNLDELKSKIEEVKSDIEKKEMLALPNKSSVHISAFEELDKEKLKQLICKKALSVKQGRELFLELLNDLQDDFSEVKSEFLVKYLGKDGFSKNQVLEIASSLEAKGEIFKPKLGYYKLTKRRN